MNRHILSTARQLARRSMSILSTPPASPNHTVGEDVAGDTNVTLLAKIARDFRTDTVTVPSDAMLLAGLKASRGDDVYGEDATTAAFERRVAAMAGKEAAMYCLSGTMSNQLGLRTWLTQPPHSVLCDFRAHVHKYEAGGIAFHSQASTTTLLPSNGHHLSLENDVVPNLVLGDDIHSCPTRIVSLENTLNGTIFPQEEIVKISEHVRQEGIIMHLDGARLWNVAAETGASLEELPKVLKELCDPFDSVSLCMSKGLGAPLGSVLVGPAAFIRKAKHFRKLFGGGVRQSGCLSAAADFALTHNFGELRRTHVLARKLEQGLRELGARILVPAETSMVFYDLSPLNISSADLATRAAALPRPITLWASRLVVHLQTEPEAIDDLLALIKEMKGEQLTAGWVVREEEAGKEVDPRLRLLKDAGRPLYNSAVQVGSK